MEFILEIKRENEDSIFHKVKKIVRSNKDFQKEKFILEAHLINGEIKKYIITYGDIIEIYYKKQ